MVRSTQRSKTRAKEKEIIIQEQDNSETLSTEDSIINEPKVNDDDSRQTHFIAYEPGVVEPFPVKATDEIYSGSGFIVNNGTQIITNQHVIEGNKTIYVRNGIGELRKATVKKAVKSDDLALLDLERPFNSEYSLDIPNNYKLRIGQKAYVMGFPLADFLGENMPSITEGIISKDVGMLNYPETSNLPQNLTLVIVEDLYSRIKVMLSGSLLVKSIRHTYWKMKV